MKTDETLQETLKENETLFMKKLFKNFKALSSFNQKLVFLFMSLIIIVIFWSATTWIPIVDKGNGILINKTGLTLITSSSSGLITSFKVEDGQSVKKGDLLVEIENTEAEAKVAAIKLKLENLEKEYQQLQSQIKIENEARINALNRDIEANKNMMKQTQQEIKSYAYELALRKRFFKKGLISNALVQQMELGLVQAEIESESIKEKLAQLYAELSKGYRSEELSDKAIQIEEQKKELNQSEGEKNIYSSMEGTIISLLKNSGILVQVGDPLLLIEPATEQPEDNIIYGYFSIEAEQDFEEGTRVQISFLHISENEYGKISGVITSISDYAVSADRLMNTFHNKEMIDYLLGNYTAVVEVVITPNRNPHNLQEFLWSSGKTPDIEIRTGSFCTLYAIIEEVKPLYFVLPSSSLTRTPHQK